MGLVLIIAEKPSQAEMYAKAFNGVKKGDHFEIKPCLELPKGAIIVSAAGHLVELYDAGDYCDDWKEWTLESLPIMPEKFKMKIIDSKRQFYNIIKKYVNDSQVSLIINGADPAREGEAIAMLPLLMMNNKKPVKRLWTASLTPESIQKAFRNLKEVKETHSIFLESLARQRSDWLIGISSSRALTLLLNQKGINKTFSCGRVQTSLVGIIYQREKAIEEFLSQPYWDCHTEFIFGEKKLTGKWFKEDADHIFSKDAADALVEYCSNQKAQVYSVNTEEKIIKPPQLFNLDSLQTEANRLYGIAPSQVLSLAQSLYEKGYLSYPRTSSKYLTPEEAKQFPTILRNLSEIQEYAPYILKQNRDLSIDKRYTDISKIEDHYAILLTEQKVNPVTLPKGERLIYDMVAKSIIVAHYPDYIFDVTEIIVVVDQFFAFKSKGKQIKEIGWKSVFKVEKETEKEDIVLPMLKVGEQGNTDSMIIIEGKTKSLPRFSEGDLIKIMSNAGFYVSERAEFTNEELSLGTPATRAGIINTIKTRYIKVEKNLVYLLPEGRILIEALGPNSFLTSVLTTGKMEQFLSDIGKGQKSLEEFMERTKMATRLIIEKLIEESKTWDFLNCQEQIKQTEHIGLCQLCGSPVVDKGNFYGCTGYKELNCNFKIPKDKLGKAISKTNAKKLLETGSTSLIKDFKSKTKDKMFDAYLVWDNHKQMVTFKFQNDKK